MSRFALRSRSRSIRASTRSASRRGRRRRDLLVTHVTLAAGRSYVLTPYGPTTSFRNLDDQLAVPRPTPTGPSSMRQVLGARVDRGAAAADRARHHRRSRGAAQARAPHPDRSRRPRVSARRRPARRPGDAHRAARRSRGRCRAQHRASARRGGARGLRRRLAISGWRRTRPRLPRSRHSQSRPSCSVRRRGPSRCSSPRRSERPP